MDAYSVDDKSPHGGNGRNGHIGLVNGAGDGAARSAMVTINGRDIDLSAITLKGPAEQALLAADLKKAGWPAWLVQTLTQANPGYKTTAVHLTDQQRELIDQGRATLAHFHNAKRKLNREIEVFLKRPGVVARVLTVLDRMTAPTSVPAE